MSVPLCVFGAPGGTIASMNLGPTELLIILAIVLLIFGGTKLPKLARSLGEAKKEFESSSNDDKTTTVTKVVETKETADGDSQA
jgi:sec-independent protein translocase protein TatA